jgi:hypothetical protein
MKTIIKVMISTESQGSVTVSKTFDGQLPLVQEIDCPGGRIPVVNSMFDTKSGNIALFVILKITDSQFLQVKNSFRTYGWL